MSAHVVKRPDQPPSFTHAPERPLGRELAHVAIGALALSLLFALAGAFDTDDLGFPRRWALWLVIATTLIGLAALLDAGLSRLAPARPGWRGLAAAGAVALTAPLMTLAIYLLKRTPLPPPWWGDDGFLELMAFTAPTSLVGATVVVLLRLPGVRGAVRIAELEDQVVDFIEISARPAIAGLLPAPKDLPVELSAWPEAPVLSVQAHDHYLEIVTAESRAFIRGRMRDAVARLKNADGLQVHRSWWAARAAVSEVRREGRDHTVVLKDGTELPVGRGRVRVLRAKGWL